MAVHTDAFPACEGRHYDLHAGFNRAEITGSVDIAYKLLIALGFTAIHPVQRAAVTDKVFGSRDHMFVGKEVIGTTSPLQALDHLAGEGTDNAWIFRPGFVGAAPVIITRNGNGGGEI